MKEGKRRIFLWTGIGVLLVLVVVFVALQNPKPTPEHVIESGGRTIYYKGPMKGKGGQSATDNLNPDIAGDNP